MRIKTILVTLAGLLALTAGMATTADASSFKGTLAVATSPPCDFEMTTAPGPPPPAAQTLQGATFTGDPAGPSGNACVTSPSSVSDINLSFAIDVTHFDAIAASGFTYTQGTCVYTATSTVTLHGGIVINGPYAGSFSMVGAPFPCITAPFALSNFEYIP